MAGYIYPEGKNPRQLFCGYLVGQPCPNYATHHSWVPNDDSQFAPGETYVLEDLDGGHFVASCDEHFWYVTDNWTHYITHEWTDACSGAHEGALWSDEGCYWPDDGLPSLHEQMGLQVPA